MAIADELFGAPPAEKASAVAPATSSAPVDPSAFLESQGLEGDAQGGGSESLKAAGQAALDSLPFGASLQEQVARLFGHSVQDYNAAKTARAEAEPVGALAGAEAGAVAAMAIPLPGAGPSGSVAAAIAKGAAAQVGLAQTYRLGELAHQEALSVEPFEVEHLAAALAPDGPMAFAAFLGLAGPAAGAIARGVSAGAERAAQSATESLFKNGKAIRGSGKSVEQLARTVRGQSLLDGASSTAKAENLQARAGARLGQLGDMVPNDPVVKAQAGQLVRQLAEAHLNAPGLEAEQAQFETIARRFESDPTVTGADIYTAAKEFAERGRRTTSHVRGVFQEASQTLKTLVADTLRTHNPDLGDAFERANSDYRLYKNIATNLKSSAPQATVSDIAGRAAAGAVGGAIGKALLGPVGAAGGAAAGISAAGYQQGTRSYARLLDNLTRAMPGEASIAALQQTASNLLGTAGKASTVLSAQDSNADFAALSSHLETVTADPDTHAGALADALFPVGPELAQATAAHLTQRDQQLAAALPKSVQVPGAFQEIPAIPDSAKRAFMREAHAAYSPHQAILSGDPAQIALAQKYNPETVKAVRAEVIRRLQDPKVKLSFRQKQRLSALVGTLTPGQDPIAGAMTQQMHAQKRAEGQEGQGSSARTAKATRKADKASLTRAERVIGEDGNK